MQSKISEEFKRAFAEGYNAYIKGEWTEAKEFLDQADKHDPGDGPTKSLISFIEESKVEEWEGFRPILA